MDEEGDEPPELGPEFSTVKCKLRTILSPEGQGFLPQILQYVENMHKMKTLAYQLLKLRYIERFDANRPFDVISDSLLCNILKVCSYTNNSKFTLTSL